MLRPTRPEDAEAACALVQAGFDTFARFSPGWTAPDETGPESVALAAARFEDPTAFARVEDVPAAAWRASSCGVRRTPIARRATAGCRTCTCTGCSSPSPAGGDGLAARLHDVTVAAMRERGVGTARLNTPRGQARSRAFYERRGWRRRLAPWHSSDLGLELVEYGLALP